MKSWVTSLPSISSSTTLSGAICRTLSPVSVPLVPVTAVVPEGSAVVPVPVSAVVPLAVVGSLAVVSVSAPVVGVVVAPVVAVVGLVAEVVEAVPVSSFPSGGQAVKRARQVQL